MPFNTGDLNEDTADISYLERDCDKQTDRWIWRVNGKEPTADQERLMFALVMQIYVEFIMTNHTYTVGDQIYLQLEGGGIGLEANV